MRARRHTSRQAILTAAVIAAAGAGHLIAPQPANADLMIDLRIAGVNGVQVTGDRKTTAMNFGDTLTLNVVAVVSGTNSVQQVGNFDGSNPSTDTRNDDTIKLVMGGFVSSGGIKGNFQGGVNSNQGAGNTLLTWSAAGSNNGIAQDFDSDGDLDLGAIGTDPTNMWLARASSQMIPTVSKRTIPVQTRFGVSIAGNTGASAGFAEDTGGDNTAFPDTRILNANTAETLLGELTWIMTGGSGTVSINFVPSADSNAAALWTEDGNSTAKTPANASFSVGAPVVFPNDSIRTVTWSPSSAGGNTNWNTSTSNWLVSGNPTAFQNFDDALFDNGGVGNVVIQPAGVFPTRVRIMHTSGTYIFSGGPIKGGAGLELSGGGTTVLAMANQYLGATQISGGSTLIVDGGDDRMGATTSTVVLDNGTLRTQGASIISARDFQMNGAGGTFDTNGLDSTITGRITGTAIFEKTGAGTLTLVGANTHNGAVIIQGGTLQLGNGGTTGYLGSSITNNATLIYNTSGNASTLTIIGGTGSLIKRGTGRIAFENNIGAGSVTIENGTLEMAAIGTNYRRLRAGSLNITGTGKLNLQYNKLIVTGVGATGSWNGSAYTGVTGLIAAGKGSSNNWDGATGIVTTQNNAIGSNYTTLGVAKASDVRPNTATDTTLWGGAIVTGTDTLVMYTYGGDANLDGRINVDDYVKIDVGIVAGLTGWANGDFNYDGVVNIDDYTTIIDANIGNQNGVFPTSGGIGESVVAVPEPAFTTLFAIPLLGFLRRRRR